MALAGHASIGSAQAGTAGLKSIVCGGKKSGEGWLTNPYGGYVGGGCDAGIDYANTPTYPQSDSYYDFGNTDGGKYVFWAWIPTVHATATIDFDLQDDQAFAERYTVYEAPVSGWIRLNFPNLNYSSSCLVTSSTLTNCAGHHIGVFASTGAYHGQIGLDAIKALPPGVNP